MENREMSNEMIERVARALDLFIDLDEGCQCKQCEYSKALNNRYGLDQARKAIKAMRKPTSAICAAMRDCESGNYTVKEAWKNIIDAALKDG